MPPARRKSPVPIQSRANVVIRQLPEFDSQGPAMEATGGALDLQTARLLVLLAGVSLSVGCHGSAEEAFQKGVAAQEADRFSEAIAAYTAAIHLDPQLAMAFFNRGLARLHVEDFEGAVEDLSRARELRADDADVLLARGAALHALRQDDKAVLDFTAALKLDEADAEIYRQRAFSWQALDESDAAIADLGMAICLEPDRPELYLDRAEIRRQRGDDPGAAIDEMLARFSQAIAESDDLKMRTSRGQAFFHIAEYELALADLNAVLKKEPAEETALMTRGQTLFVLGDSESALSDYTAVIKAGGQRVPAALASRAVLFEDRGDFAGAIRDYTQAICASADNYDLLARCAWLLATCPNPELRDGQRAVEYAERACSLTDWNDWLSLDAHAAASAESGDFEWAVTCQERAVANGPKDQLGPLHARLEAYRNHQAYHVGESDADVPK
jgi:serine/threonine-protein kinase